MASQINASNSGFGGIVSTGDSSGVLQLQTTGTTAVTLDTSQNATFAGKVTSAGALTLASNGSTTAVTIDTSQNVGIGTTSPSRKLDVSSASTAGNAIEIGNTNTQSTTLAAINTTGTTYSFSGVGGSTSWYYGNKTVALGTDSANPIQFIANGSERMRIDSSGRAGIAKSSGLTGQLNVGNGQGFNPPVSSQIGLAAIVTDGGYGGGISLLDGTTGYSFWCEGNGANFYLRRASTTTSYTGGVALINAATSWSSASDENIKDIIEPIQNAIEKVSTLRTVIGKYKDEEEGVRHPFLIAQDVEKVLPEAVNIMHEGEDNECLGLSYTDTIPLLVAAIKEQQTIINDLKARVTALEAK